MVGIRKNGNRRRLTVASGVLNKGGNAFSLISDSRLVAASEVAASGKQQPFSDVGHMLPVTCLVASRAY
jgi:hypothetical protein